MSVVKLLVLLISQCGASYLHIGADTVRLSTILHNKHIGPQVAHADLPARLGLDAKPVVFTKANTLCESHSPDFNNTVVFVQGSQQILSHTQSSSWALCAERRGAVAVVFTVINNKYPGMPYLCSFLSTGDPVGIPVLETAEPDFNDVVSDYSPISGWTISVVADKNPWQDLFSTAAFKVLFRGLLALLAAFALFRCSACLLGHILRPPVASTTSHWVSTRALVILILVVEVIGSLMLLVLAVCGPIMSSDMMPYELHWAFLYTPPVTSAFSSMVGIALFVRWGAVDIATARTATEKATVGVGAGSVLLMVLLIGLLIGRVITRRQFIMAVGAIAIISSMYTFVMFLLSGVRFLKRISENATSSTSKWAVARRQKSLESFLQWIKMSSVANFLLFAPSLFMVITPFTVGRTPEVSAGTLLVVYVGALIQSISQSYGLHPRVYREEEKRAEALAGQKRHTASTPPLPPRTPNTVGMRHRVKEALVPEVEILSQLWGRRSSTESDSDHGVAVAIYPNSPRHAMLMQAPVDANPATESECVV